MNLTAFLKNIIYNISPKILVQIEYFHVFHKLINWKHPRDLNEKIQWLKFNSDISLWTLLADKYRVREYVKNKNLDKLLVNLYGKWDDINDVDWNSLPDRFVMKVNNGSGDILVCKDKSKLDIPKQKRIFAQLLSKKFGYLNGEMQYENMPPCVIAEELLDCCKQPIETDTLIDYKIWCFDGKPYCIWVCYNRYANTVEVGTYDLDWNYHPEWSVYTGHYREAKKTLPRPKSLDEMLIAASILSQGFPQVRVDLYEVNEKPYFGELTFTSAGGFMDFYTEDFLVQLGNQVILPKK